MAQVFVEQNASDENKFPFQLTAYDDERES